MQKGSSRQGKPEGVSGMYATGIFFDEDVLAYTDRTHQHNGETVAGLPANWSTPGQRQLHLPTNDNYTYRLITDNLRFFQEGGDECGRRINR